MVTDLGGWLGIALMILFGATVAIVVPALIRREPGAGESDDGNRMVITWVRILGGIVVAVGVIQLILALVLTN